MTPIRPERLAGRSEGRSAENQRGDAGLPAGGLTATATRPYETISMLSRRAALLWGVAGPLGAADEPELDLFFQIVSPNAKEARAARLTVKGAWRNGYAILLLELMRLVQDQPTKNRIAEFLSELTRQSFGSDLRQWMRWAWTLPYAPHSRYAEFKGKLYANIDPRMQAFFPPRVASVIRLDQVEWGGVPVNGIPPLVQPAMLTAKEAVYLKDAHVVFGIQHAGEAKAYPKRILAWHEMALDRVGELDLTIVYCTLCGTVIPYRSLAGGRKHTFGTSGLLYQSSKMMFDAETQSLWSTAQGKPVVGTLVGAGLELDFVPIVTTNWGEWRRKYPHTQVLSLDTGYRRDYSEGAAYRDYFATDELMFDVARRDTRLRNKDEVLVIRLKGKRPLAVAAKFLQRRPLHKLEHEGVKLTIRTDGGANLVFVEGQPIPAHRAFWFGWYAQFPETVLVR